MRYFLLMLLIIVFSPTSWANETVLSKPVQWFSSSWEEGLSAFQAVNSKDSYSLTGETQVSYLSFQVMEDGEYVVDFRNSALINRFEHHLVDKQGLLHLSVVGGIASKVTHEFFLRHGVRVYLPAGEYSLITRQESKFNIAPPTPFVISYHDYVEDIKVGNAITLIGIGVFFALFLYYFVLSITRKNIVDLTYALFILGNLLFNSTTLLVFSDLFGWRSFVGASWPIFFSNIAYIVFVLTLLEISRRSNPILWSVGVGILSLFVCFIVVGALYPNYQNEINRIAVGIFISYGLLVGLVKSFKGNMVARWYVVANLGFFVLATVAISQEQIAGLNTIYMSHIGLLAVAIEVLLLSCVVSYQMSLVEEDKTKAVKRAQDLVKLAHTDLLTQLPNRYAMDLRLQQVTDFDAFIYIDLDGLKHCNDTYGHDEGDKLLVGFSRKLSKALPQEAEFYRIAGDEFAIIYPASIGKLVVADIHATEAELKQELKAFAGVSFGVAMFNDHDSVYQAVNAADADMYLNKKRRKRVSSSQENTAIAVDESLT